MRGFWGVMSESRTVQTLVPHERWDADRAYSTEQQPGMSYARFAACLKVRLSDAVQA